MYLMKDKSLPLM